VCSRTIISKFGADVEAGAFYAGTWWADVAEGVEYDV
jgi:hypothetical protein